MSERRHEAMVELRDVLNDIRCEADATVYGFICVENPNDFHPDPECSTDEERARHKAACEEWNKTGKNPNPGPHCAFMTGGKEPPGFGLGTNVTRNELLDDWADRLQRCINRLESE